MTLYKVIFPKEWPHPKSNIVHTKVMTTNFERNHFEWYRTKEIYECLNKGLMKQALYLAILLPDVCTNYRGASNKLQEDRFVTWVNKNITFYNKDTSERIPFMDTLNGKVLYLLRNKLVHGDPKKFEDLYKSEKSKLKTEFSFEDVRFKFICEDISYFNYYQGIDNKNYGIISISIPQIVKQIISCAEAEYESNPNNEYYVDALTVGSDVIF